MSKKPFEVATKWFAFIRCAQRCPNMFSVLLERDILGDPGAVSRVGINSGENFNNRRESPWDATLSELERMNYSFSLVANQFHDSLECLSLTEYKIKVFAQSEASIYRAWGRGPCFNSFKIKAITV